MGAAKAAHLPSASRSEVVFSPKTPMSVVQHMNMTAMPLRWIYYLAFGEAGNAGGGISNIQYIPYIPPLPLAACHSAMPHISLDVRWIAGSACRHHYGLRSLSVGYGGGRCRVWVLPPLFPIGMTFAGLRHPGVGQQSGMKAEERGIALTGRFGPIIYCVGRRLMIAQGGGA